MITKQAMQAATEFMRTEYFWLNDEAQNLCIQPLLDFASKAVAEERQRAADENEVVEMRLCETLFVYLKPDVLYRFTVAPECEKCKEVAELSKVEVVK